jgi:drug/metabolite transporter (DMT)-like permease
MINQIYSQKYLATFASVLKEHKQIQGSDWLNFFALSIVWGFSFFFIKKGLEVFAPMEVAAFRMTIAFLVLLPFIIYHFKRIRIPAYKWKYIPLLGLFGNLIPAVMFCTAETRIDSGIVGIMNATTPLFALFIGSLFFQVALTRNKIIGVLVGFVGTVMIVLSKMDGLTKGNINVYILMPVVATICYGINANLFKRYFQDEDPLIIALLQYTAVALITTPYLFFSGAIDQVRKTPGIAWSSIKYLILLGTLGTGFAQVGFNILTQRTSALFATMTTFVIPVVSVLIGFYIGEKILAIHIAGLATILAGVYIGSRT